MIQVFFVCLFAGVVAGIEIGFASVSAATIIAPILIALLGVPWYEAIGIGLAADVLAAAFAAYEYRKQIDVKNGLIMLAFVLIMTFVGSYFSQYLPNTEMSWISIILSLICGLRFLRSAGGKEGKNFLSFFMQWDWMKRVLAIGVGCYIGFWCGFVGAGGGMMMLFGLTIILGYEVKTAVGTGVFIMIFTALIGAVSHGYFGDMQDYIPALIFCCIFTFIAAWISSKFANRMETRKTSLVTGTILLVLCVCLIIKMAVSLV
ncbi:MAG: sulfite exporter TauE/SafE family protein [Clostridiales bacterium]|nr:sulfite exporter TauE/SafE family protein [Clostridiales bacterium]